MTGEACTEADCGFIPKALDHPQRVWGQLRTIFVPVGLAVALAGCQPTTEVVSSEPIAIPAEALAARDVCLEAMPDVRATEQAFRALGYPAGASTESVTVVGGDIEEFAVILGGTPTSCVLLPQGMDQRGAEALIAPWVRAANARPIRPLPTMNDITDAIPPGNSIRVVEGWGGVLNGTPVGLLIAEYQNQEFMLGGLGIAMSFPAQP